MNKAKLIGALIGAILVIIVILQNSVPVTIKILFLDFTLPNAVLIGLTWLIGLATGILVALNVSHTPDKGKVPPERNA